MERTWVEVEKDALRANVRVLRDIIGQDCILSAVVKANAYGHGMEQVVRTLRANRAFRGNDGQHGCFAVDSVDEAVQLRAIDEETPVLVLGYVPVEHARAVVQTRAHVVVAERTTLAALSRVAPRRIPIHVKVETGTQRQGVREQDLPAFVRYAMRLPHVTIAGVTTHLADVEDTGSRGFSNVQLARFDRAARAVERICGEPIMRHAGASAAAMVLPESRYDMVRAGIALYGLWPSERVHTALLRGSPSYRLQPALTWKTILGSMHWVPRGAPIGYGCTERTRRRTRVAVLPVGYWDGFDRSLSRVAHVLVRGRRCRVLGRVCMNMVIVDITNVPHVKLEDEVVLIGHQRRERVGAEEHADHAGTISYEIVTRINPRIRRKFV
jgi:alanine racemase